MTEGERVLKKITVVLLFALLLSVLAACGTDPADGTDTSAVPTERENRYVFRGVSLVLPGNYVVEETSYGTIAYAVEEKDRSDNIHFSVSEADSVSGYTRESIEKVYDGIADGYEGIEYYEQKEIDGVDVLVYRYHLKAERLRVEQTQVIVFFPDRSVVLTFTGATGAYSSAFERAVQSIRIVPEEPAATENTN